jgi:hypothetical protein
MAREPLPARVPEPRCADAADYACRGASSQVAHVLKADAVAPDSGDFCNLLSLAKRAAPKVIVLLLKEGLRLVGPRLPRPMDRAINLSVALLFVAFCILLPFRLMTDV